MARRCQELLKNFLIVNHMFRTPLFAVLAVAIVCTACKSPQSVIVEEPPVEEELVVLPEEDIIEERLLDELQITAPRSYTCLLYTSPSPRDKRQSRMPSSA